MIGSVLGRVLGVGHKVAVPALVAYGSINSFQDRVRQGQNPAFAIAAEGVSFAANMMLPMPAQLALMGIPITRAATSAVISSVGRHNNFVRLAKTPFSHRYEPNETCWRAQQMGLQAIGAAWGHANMGSEAGAFSRRYGRNG